MSPGTWPRGAAHRRGRTTGTNDSSSAGGRWCLTQGADEPKSGYPWEVAHDDRPWAGPDPPPWSVSPPGASGAEHGIGPLAGLSGIPRSGIGVL
jgi:hypothetical protein